MNLITSTQLRTETPKLIEALLNGQTVNFIHRSKIIGEFRPKGDDLKVFKVKQFLEAAKKLNLTPTSPQQREQIYQKHLMKKYGKHLS